MHEQKDLVEWCTMNYNARTFVSRKRTFQSCSIRMAHARHARVVAATAFNRGGTGSALKAIRFRHERYLQSKSIASFRAVQAVTASISGRHRTGVERTTCQTRNPPDFENLLLLLSFFIGPSYVLFFQWFHLLYVIGCNRFIFLFPMYVLSQNPSFAALCFLDFDEK